MTNWKRWAAGTSCVFLALLFLPRVEAITGRDSIQLARRTQSASKFEKEKRLDDSVQLKPARDLVLKREGQRKAEALAHFVEGMSFEENGEIEKALADYRKVLNVDPGQVDLACRVAALLSRQDEFPEAIDILKDAVKAAPEAAEPYLQLGFIYAKYLKKTDQALEYCNRGIALDPQKIEGYQRLYEIALAPGTRTSARQALDRAARVKSNDPAFWTRLGKLYALLVFKPDVEPKPNEINRVNEFFKKAADRAGDNPAVLKEVADYYASSQQLKRAIPLYLRVLELQPDDTNAREKLATGFILTNQRGKAVELLEEMIKQRPEKYQAYDLLAQVLDDQARTLQRENKTGGGESQIRQGGGKLRAERADQSESRDHLRSARANLARPAPSGRTGGQGFERGPASVSGCAAVDLLFGLGPAGGEAGSAIRRRFRRGAPGNGNGLRRHCYLPDSTSTTVLPPNKLGYMTRPPTSSKIDRARPGQFRRNLQLSRLHVGRA